MQKISKELAAKIAKHCLPTDSWDEIREYVDTYSGGDLDTFQLDMLTDWVKSAIPKAA